MSMTLDPQVQIEQQGGAWLLRTRWTPQWVGLGDAARGRGASWDKNRKAWVFSSEKDAQDTAHDIFGWTPNPSGKTVSISVDAVSLEEKDVDNGGTSLWLAGREIAHRFHADRPVAFAPGVKADPENGIPSSVGRDGDTPHIMAEEGTRIIVTGLPEEALDALSPDDYEMHDDSELASLTRKLGVLKDQQARIEERIGQLQGQDGSGDPDGAEQ